MNSQPPRRVLSQPFRLTDQVPHPCGSCRFGEASVWQPVADGQRDVLARSLQRRALGAGETLYLQGASNEAVYCLSRGLIALRSYRPDGGSALVRLVYPGDLLGFRSFLAHDRHQTAAIALAPSRVCLVAHQDARRIAAGSPQTVDRIARRCAEELARARSWQCAAVKTGNQRRMAQLIVQLADALAPGSADPARVRVPLSRQDMAAVLGIETETASRLIGRLKRETGLVISGRWLELQSLDGLRALL